MAISKNDAWTEGSYDTSAGSIFHTLIEHWNGSQWSVVKSPSPGTNDFLNDLSAVSASDVWTVGNSTFSGGVLFALIGLAGIVSAAIAYGWVGMILTIQQNMIGAEVPSSVQTVLR